MFAKQKEGTDPGVEGMQGELGTQSWKGPFHIGADRHDKGCGFHPG